MRMCRHTINLSTVELLNITEDTNVVILDKVDGNTLATETTRSTDSVNVELTVVGEVVVDHQRHLLYIDTTSPNVRGNQHATIKSHMV